MFGALTVLTMTACRPASDGHASQRDTHQGAQRTRASAPSNATLSQIDPGLPPHKILRYRWKKGPWGIYDFGMQTQVQRGKQTQTTSIAARLRIRVAWVQDNHAHLLADFPAVGKTRPARALVRVSRALSHLVVSMDLDDRGRSILVQSQNLEAAGAHGASHDRNTRVTGQPTNPTPAQPTNQTSTGTDMTQGRQTSARAAGSSLSNQAIAAMTCPLPKAPVGPGARWTGRLSQTLGPGLPQVTVAGRYHISSIQGGLVTIDVRFELDSAGSLLPHRPHDEQPTIHGTGTGRWTVKADTGLIQSANSRFEVHVQSGKDQVTVIQTTWAKRLTDQSLTQTSPTKTARIR